MDGIHTLLGAWVAGTVTSVHCLGMCGPLACGVASMPATEAQRLAAISAYHISRLFSYGLIGALCGALGQQPLLWFFDSPAQFLPWLLVLILLIFGFGLEKKLPRPVSLVRFTSKARFKMSRHTPLHSGLILGLLTPLLPCGPLYLLFGAALLSGSGSRGAEFALCFGFGTVPLLWLAQTQIRFLRARLKPQTLQLSQRILAISAAIMMTLRLWDTLPFSASDSNVPIATPELPSCCH